MTKPITKSKHGFTIIEVVLVLAIAGLIFLMVFIALPALQRNQKNTQRRNDYSMLSTAVTNYMSNNGGRVSGITTIQDPDETRWINANGTDPDGNQYELLTFTYDNWYNGGTVRLPSNVHSDSSTQGSQVFVIVGANCNGADSNGDAQPSKDRSANAFVVYGFMDGGSYYCQANGATDAPNATQQNNPQ